MAGKIKGNRIVLYPHKCTGCKLCEMACSLIHNGSINPTLSKIKITCDHSEGLVTITVHSDCSLCDKPDCHSFCETGAIKLYAEEYDSLSI
jgi:carbon-monoxide dehydrogenase iron sulfur subunit